MLQTMILALSRQETEALCVFFMTILLAILAFLLVICFVRWVFRVNTMVKLLEQIRDAQGKDAKPGESA